MEIEEHIEIDPQKRSGKPCIRGSRIAVYDIFDLLASGQSVDEILEDFPQLKIDDITACFKFAADRERRLLSA